MSRRDTVILLLTGLTLATVVIGQGGPPATSPAASPVTATAPVTARTSVPTASTPAELAKLAAWRGAAVNSADTFRFAVLSDNTGEHEPGVLEQAVAQINLLRPDFVVNTGDLVEGFEKDLTGAEKEWDEIENLLGKLNAPFFYCLGNHDAPNPTYRKAYARQAAKSPTAGRPWYSFNYRGCHFLFLDSTAMEREIPGLCEEQWAWLARDLAAARDARHVFVFEHHPLFNDRGDWMRLRKMLHDGKTTIFSGHDHSLSYAVEHGLPYLALGPTGGFGGEGAWEKGGTHQFAWVTVSNAAPSIAIVPVGHVLPHDLRTGRQAAARHRALWWGAELSPVTRAGGQTVLTLPNASDIEATYKLAWTGSAGWFGQSPPALEIVNIPAGRSIQRTYRLEKVADASAPPPVLELEYSGTAGEQEVKGIGQAALFARGVLTAGRAGKLVVDGKLDDWKGVPVQMLGARWQTSDGRQAWQGPADASAGVQLAHDEQFLYVAMDVSDDVLFTDAKESWRRDGVEVFWDPRGPEERGGPFAMPCQQVTLALPADGQALAPELNPEPAGSAAKIQAACQRRQGGYTVELAVPLAVVLPGGKAAPGQVLRMDFAISDRDEADPPPTPATGAARTAATSSAGKPKPKPLAPTTYLTLSGYGKPNYRTHAYVEVMLK